MTTWVGRSVERLEDDALLRGEGWFMDDLAPLPHIAEAAVVRSTQAHAEIVSVDVSAALEVPGVIGVLTGADVAALSRPFPSAIGRAVQQWATAVDRVRYVGEPVAVVVAEDRYGAEDAAELVVVEYSSLPVAASPEAALADGAPVLHEAVGGNVVSDRSFSYGDAAGRLAGADLVVRRRFRHPRSSCTPVECAGVICAWDAATGSVTAWSNFQGPFTLHGVAAAALGIPPGKLRLVSPPDSGGSFGVKAGVFTTVVLMALASRRFGVPVRWTEDRVEHLLTSAATERLTGVEAGFTSAGELVALRLDLVDDVGAYVRAPEPATLYRMHGCITGPYRVRDVDVRSRVVVTNRCPTGLNRGFGGPQLTFALERTMAIAAARLGLDPADVVRRNLVPASAMPYRAPAGGVYDSGDYGACFERALELAGYDELRREQEARRPRLAVQGAAKRGASPDGRVLGIGIACVVEPSASNMGYITLVDPPDRRAATPPKDGNAETVAIAMDAGGGVTVSFTSTPQGQGHRTVAAQIVADALGVAPGDVTVLPGADTAARPFTVSAGNYSSRFAVAVVSGVHVAAVRLADRVRAAAAEMLECAPGDVELVDGAARVVGTPDRSVPLRRVAGAAHWDPAGLPDGVENLALTTTFSVPGLAAPASDDTVNSSAAYGFLADVAVVEVDTDTGEVRVRDYVTVHDAGRVLHPALAEGQVLGGLAHGLGAALLERHVYDEAGNLLTTTFVDYPTPTATELPRPATAMVESPSPVTPIGAKGLGEGTTMSAPAAIANAVADALGLDALDLDAGVDLELPLTPARVWASIEADAITARRGAGPPRFGGARGWGPGRGGEAARSTVKPPVFRYERPATLKEALGLLAEYGDEARPLAGGQSLVPMLNLRLAAPNVVVDLNGLASLDGLDVAGGSLTVGALLRQRTLELSPKAAAIGALADGLPLVGHVATRNRGTVGGSVAHADPAAELPLALLALGGSVVADGPDGRRQIPAEKLFAGFLTTTLRPDELVTEVRFPVPREREGSALLEVAQRHGDFPLAAVAVTVLLDADGRIGAARVAAGAVADRPLLLPEAAAALVGGAGPEEAGRVAAGEVEPSGSLHAPADYQRHLVGVLVARAVDRARSRAETACGVLEGVTHAGGAPHAPKAGCTVNGRTASLASVPDRRLLSDFLRHDLGLRGTHVGCEHGVCGACTIRLDGAAVRSCLLLARQADGAEITTVEGLATADATAGGNRAPLHPLQAAFKRHFALQCGFCTAGILMAAVELLERATAPPDEDEIRRLLSGHLCRCTGYEPIVAAIREAAVATRPGAAATREDPAP